MKIGTTTMKLIVKWMGKADHKRRKTWPSIDAYRHRLDIDALGDQNFFHQFDVFYADESKRNGNVVIDIHGGAYIYGDRKNNFGFASVFLDRGFDVVLLDYEPNDGSRDCISQIQTLAAELAYLQSHAEELGLDSSRFHLTGDSAGGHFALFLAECAQNLEISSQISVHLNGISFSSIAAICPVYDFRRSVHTPLMNDKAKVVMFGSIYQDEAKVALIDPRVHRSALTQPLFVSTCRNDFLIEESRSIKEDWEKDGKPLEFVFVDNKSQKVGHVHNVTDIGLSDSIRVNEAIISFFQKHSNN